MSVKKKIAWGIIIVVILIIAFAAWVILDPELSAAFMEGYNESRQH